MNRLFYPTADALLFRMSDNAEHYRATDGKYKVTYNKTQKRIFPTLVEAFLFYITLEDEADLWDVSKKDTTLIERKIKFCLN